MFCQENISLGYFLDAARQNDPSLQENENLKNINDLQNKLINAQNNGYQVDVTSEIMEAPYFNSNGKFIDFSRNPSPNAYGYAEPVSNGGLYSAQLNITKNIFNRAIAQNLLFQNKLKNNGLKLSTQQILHNLQKNIIDAYIQTFQQQIKITITKEIISDLEKRLKVVEILVKNGILMQSDYLLLQLDLENRRLELEQTINNLRSKYLNLVNISGIAGIEFKPLQPPRLNFEMYKLNTEVNKIGGKPELSVYRLDSLTTDRDTLNYQENPLRMIPDSINSQKENPVYPTGSSAANSSMASYQTGDQNFYYERKYRNDSLQLVAGDKVFENKYKPLLSAYATTGLNAVEVNRIPHNMGMSAGIRLSIPIYDGGQRKLNRLQTELKKDNLQFYRKNEQIKLQNTRNSLQEQIASIQRGLKLINAQLEKQKNILEIFKGKMVQGQVSIIDYLNLIQNYKLNIDTRLQMQINLWLLENEYYALNW